MEIWRKNLYILWATQFLAMMGMNLVVPFLPFFVRELGVNDERQVAQWSGFVFAAPFLTAFIAIPFWGSIGDRHGRKIMVVRAIYGLAISQVLIGFSQDVLQLFFFRLLQGAISGFIAASLALVSTNTPPEKTGYALGVLQSSTAAGMVLGPFVGGLLADLIGYREIFFVTAILCALGGIVIVALVKEVGQPTIDARKYTVLDNFKLMYLDRRLRIIGFAFVVGQISVLMIEPVFALFIESFNTDTAYLSTLTGAIFSISGLFMVISAPWWGKRNDRKGYKKNLAFALGATGLAYAGHIVVADLVQLAVLRAVLGFVRGAVLPTLYALTSIHAPPERRGGMIAVASSLTILGNMLGPIIGGTIAARFEIIGSFVANCILLLGTSLLIWKYLEDDRRTPAPQPLAGGSD